MFALFHIIESSVSHDGLAENALFRSSATWGTSSSCSLTWPSSLLLCLPVSRFLRTFTYTNIKHWASDSPNKMEGRCVWIGRHCTYAVCAWCRWFAVILFYLFFFTLSESESGVERAGFSAPPLRSDLRPSALLRTHSNPHLPWLPDLHLPARA